MSWDRYELGQKNIFYDEDIRLFPAQVLPPHVERVRRSMVDFSCPIRGQKNIFDAFLLDGSLRTLSDSSDADPALKEARKALNKAISIVNGGYLEKKWENFFETHFFEALGNSLSVSRDDSRRVSRCNYFYDGMKRETNELWDLFKKDGAPGIGSFGCLKCPKPDQAFYLPIYHFNEKVGIPAIVDPEARQWNQAQDISIMEPFSWSTLSKLHEFGLQPTPFRIFQKPPLEANLKCYPWLIVEHKKEGETDGVPSRPVCCQAANAAACAVGLIRHSAQYAVQLPDQAHIPPIPVVTTIGSHVTVWIMYFAKGFDAPCSRRDTQEVSIKRRTEGFIMRAVWNGEMTKLADIVKFHMILENTHTWAMRAFKPLVSSYIEQWKLVHCQPNVDRETAQTLLKESKLRCQKTVEQRRAVLPMVQALLDDHAAMELDDMAHRKVTPLLLGLLVHQICASEREFTSREVDRVVTDRLKALNLIQEKSVNKGEEPHKQHSAIQIPVESEPEQESPTFRSSPVTQELPIDNDDPNDSDYRQSQVTSALGTDAAAAEASDAEVSVAQSSDHEFSDQVTPLWRPQRDIVTPRAKSTRGPVPSRPSLHSRESAPLSGSTVTESTETTPTANTLKGRFIADTLSQSSGSPQRARDRGKTTNEAPFGSPVFAGRRSPGQRIWSPGRQFGQPQSPEASEPSGSQQNSDDNSLSQPKTGITHLYTDEIKDSQESS